MGAEINWEPIGRESLGRLIVKELAEAKPEDHALFTRAAVVPAKWQLSPWGDLGGGFWVVAVFEDRVLWYNDIEEGFNVSHFVTFGTILRPSTGAIRTNYVGQFQRLRDNHKGSLAHQNL